jgi:hypothetical protein
MASKLDNLQVFSVNLFDWKKSNYHGSSKWIGCAELSDLGGSPFHRLYEEKPGWVFSVKGREKTLTFSITKIVKDSRENEILHYILTCISDPTFEIVLFND